MAIGLPSLRDRVRKLQTSLQAKAKAEPAYRFYTLWDKVCRADVLAEAHRRCRANRGAPGVDGETFEAIAAHGIEAWLERLRQELCSRAYRPQPLLRVWIPKSDGGQRPLGIPTIRDRVVQAAMVIVLEPIFEVDLLPNQYGFRPKLDAKMAVRRAYWRVTDSGRTEVVDADLRDYFGSIPHGPLMRCVARRVADGTVLSVIKSWLEMPVVERTPRGDRRSAEARNRHRGRRRARPARPCSATSTSVGSCSPGNNTATARGSTPTSSTTPTTS
jgi:RNA-directed DNA polymerase